MRHRKMVSFPTSPM